MPVSKPAQHIYAVLRSEADWHAILNHDPHLWSYDRTGHFPVEPEALASRAAPNVWTETGWDSPPRAYPGLAIRILNPPVAAEEVAAPQEEAPRRGPRAKRKHLRKGVALQLTVPVECPEQLDCLCEVYRLTKSATVARLIADAYRRDVVESGMLAVLAEDAGIIAPRP